MMVLTVLEAHVAADQWEMLKAGYVAATLQLGRGIARTVLVRSTADATLWRIMTFWRSREALEAMRSSGQTARGIFIFRTARAEPTLAVFDVEAQVPA